VYILALLALSYIQRKSLAGIPRRRNLKPPTLTLEVRMMSENASPIYALPTALGSCRSRSYPLGHYFQLFKRDKLASEESGNKIGLTKAADQFCQ